MGAKHSSQHIIEDCGPVLDVEGNNDVVTVPKGTNLSGSDCKQVSSSKVGGAKTNITVDPNIIVIPAGLLQNLSVSGVAPPSSLKTIANIVKAKTTNQGVVVADHTATNPGIVVAEQSDLWTQQPGVKFFNDTFENAGAKYYNAVLQNPGVQLYLNQHPAYMT